MRAASALPVEKRAVFVERRKTFTDMAIVWTLIIMACARLWVPLVVYSFP
jgi:hypothetical protein